MPLLHRVLMSLGCVAQLTDDARRSVMDMWAGGRRSDPLSQVLDFDAVQLLTTTTHPYLDSGSSCYRRAFLFHMSSDMRAAVALFIVNETNVDVEHAGTASQVDRMFANTPGRKNLMGAANKKPVL